MLFAFFEQGLLSLATPNSTIIPQVSAINQLLCEVLTNFFFEKENQDM